MPEKWLLSRKRQTSRNSSKENSDRPPSISSSSLDDNNISNQQCSSNYLYKKSQPKDKYVSFIEKVEFKLGHLKEMIFPERKRQLVPEQKTTRECEPLWSWGDGNLFDEKAFNSINTTILVYTNTGIEQKEGSFKGRTAKDNMKLRDPIIPKECADGNCKLHVCAICHAVIVGAQHYNEKDHQNLPKCGNRKEKDKAAQKKEEHGCACGEICKTRCGSQSLKKEYKVRKENPPTDEHVRYICKPYIPPTNHKQTSTMKNRAITPESYQGRKCHCSDGKKRADKNKNRQEDYGRYQEDRDIYLKCREVCSGYKAYKGTTSAVVESHCVDKPEVNRFIAGTESYFGSRTFESNLDNEPGLSDLLPHGLRREPGSGFRSDRVQAPSALNSRAPKAESGDLKPKTDQSKPKQSKKFKLDIVLIEDSPGNDEDKQHNYVYNASSSRVFSTKQDIPKEATQVADKNQKKKERLKTFHYTYTTQDSSDTEDSSVKKSWSCPAFAPANKRPVIKHHITTKGPSIDSLPTYYSSRSVYHGHGRATKYLNQHSSSSSSDIGRIIWTSTVSIKQDEYIM